MILTEEIEVAWNPTTKEHYIQKGYTFTNHNEKFMIKVRDLKDTSRAIIEVKCDYCDKKQEREYGVILKSTRNCILNSYSCSDCKGVKTKAQIAEKQKRGLLKRGDKGYWNFNENIKLELKRYIKEHGTIDGISQNDYSLYEQIIKKHKSLKNLIEELGFAWNQISNIQPINHNKNFENVKNTLEDFIIKNERFPLWEELNRDLKIQIKDIAYHGGINEIKRKIGYKDDNDLVDDRGYVNKSNIEFMVAQFLIKNEISYKRDIKPFKNRHFTSDFYFEESEGESYFLEVWGYREEDKSSIGQKYGERKKEKLALYKENGLNLYSISYSDLERMTYIEIQEFLKRELSFITCKDLTVFEETKFIQGKKITSDEIFASLMKLSVESNVLPTQKVIINEGMYSYLTEIRKRYGNYHDFAECYGARLSNMARKRR